MQPFIEFRILLDRQILSINNLKKFSMRKLLLLCVFIFPLTLDAQSWSWLFNSTGGSGEERLVDVDEDAHGNKYILATTTSENFSFNTITVSNYGETDIALIKMDSLSNIVWEMNIGGTGYENVGMMTVDSEGNTYIQGTSYSTEMYIGDHTVQIPQITSTYFILKLDKDGNFLWFKELKGFDIKDLLGNEDGLVISGSAFSGFAIGGQSGGLDPENYKLSVIQLDTEGDLEWILMDSSEMKYSTESIVLAETAENSLIVGYNIWPYGQEEFTGLVFNDGPAMVDSAYIFSLSEGDIGWLKPVKNKPQFFSDILVDENAIYTNQTSVYYPGGWGGGVIGGGFYHVKPYDKLTKYSLQGEENWTLILDSVPISIMDMTSYQGDLHVCGYYFSHVGTAVLGDFQLENFGNPFPDPDPSDATIEAYVAVLNVNGEFIQAKSYGGRNKDFINHIFVQSGNRTIFGESNSAEMHLSEHVLYNPKPSWIYSHFGRELIRPYQFFSSSEQNFETPVISSKLKVHPNPILKGGMIVVEGLYGLNKCELRDQLGALVYSKKINSGQDIMHLQLPYLSAGMYTLIAYDGELMRRSRIVVSN